MSEHLRLVAQRFVALAPGEEEAAFDEALVGLAEVLDLTIAARWDVARHGGSPVRRKRWVRPGAPLQDPQRSTLPRDHPLAAVATTATEPVVVDDPQVLVDAGLLSTSALARRLTRLIVPGRSDDSVNCVLMLSRPISQGWLDWEISMVADFARLIPEVRTRLDIERRSSASFEAAPVGMVYRTDDHEIIECNGALAGFLGVDVDSLVGRRWPDLIDREAAAPDALERLEAPPTAGQRRLEVPFVHADGSTVWARLAETRVATQHGDRWLSYLEEITELHERHELAVQRATHDEVTGLANRHALFDLLGAQLEAPPDPTGRSTCAVVMIDLNDFKRVNDRCGHVVGDAVLRVLGQRLVEGTRSSDLVARYGGDEFIVVLRGPIGEDDARRVAAKLSDAMCRPIDDDGTALEVGAAVGVALARSGDAVDDVIDRADAEMYRAKVGSRARRPETVAV